ncbi:pitrilysin family protein [Phenylobacterium sp.]|uniref:M16 family metallopeptidase n=1 Tax=Phenylobacterium sp. TaxID=1871053 RepID=UPI0025CD0DF2|nr:pitrilysin family protein [Phenylobacterium sp.]MCA3715858.1 insulinase family protein [Phenylobacterium sp.]
MTLAGRLFSGASLALLLTLSTTPVISAPAPPAAVAQPAPASELARLVDIPYERFTLPNGLRVLVHTDRKAPIVAVSIWYGVGSKHEPAGRTGFAHLFEHLMFNGSENAPGDYFKPLQEVGATDLNGSTWFDRTNYFQTVPTGALDRTLFLESDRMGHLLGAVTQEKLDNQRGVVQNEKRQYDNQPFGLVDYLINDNLFPPGHGYRHSTIGSMADLDAASLDDVKRWFTDNYGPNNAVLVLAGDIDLATARPLVEKYFGAIPRGPRVAPVQDGPVTLKAPVSLTHKDRVATTRIYRSWSTPGLNDLSSVALEAGVSVLGGLSSSRLDNALVRDEKIAVSVTADFGVFQSVGILTLAADVRQGVPPDLVAKRMDQVIAALIATGPTPAELDRARRVEIAGKIRETEAVGGFGGKAVTLAEGELYANDPELYRKRLDAYAALTPATVQSALKTWLGRPALALRVDPGERDLDGGPLGGDKEAKGAVIDRTGVAAAPRAPRAEATVPGAGKVPTLDFPDIERARLANGMPVVYARRAGEPRTLIAASFDAGTAADGAARYGAQSLMLSALTEGAGGLSSREIAERSELLGARVGASAGADRSTVMLDALTPNLTPSLALYADVLRRPTFEPQVVERIRGQQLARISAEANNPQAVAVSELSRRLYGAGHPYSVRASGAGDASVVGALSPADLRALHDQWIRPDNGRLLIVSDKPLAELLPQLDAALGDWKAATGTAKGAKVFAEPPAPSGSRVVLIDRPKSPQSVISAGQVLQAKGGDDLLPLQAGNEVLGGGFLSRLNMNLRETKGWSYGVGSGVPEVAERVAFRVSAPVQADRTADSISEIVKEIRDFTTNRGTTAEERQLTIEGATRELPGQFERSASVLNGIATLTEFNRPDDWYERLPERYGAMTAADMDLAVRRVIDPSRLTFVVVGDASVVRPQLDKLGLPVDVIAAPPAAK